ncbi:Methylenetetrahydrofolate reductase [Balamuthia mandrillaris]
MKIIDKINAAIEDGHPFFSFEYFPPKTEDGVDNLYDRLDRMAIVDPLWIDVTWGAGGSTAQKTLEICKTAQQLLGLETMMHLTCTNMPRESIDEALREAKAAGIQNILALRGDPPRGEEWKKIEGGFGHAVDLVRYIRQQYGDYFGICVAGYPETHIDAESRQKDMQYLKEKVDAGADMIITQLFYDTELFLQYVKDCRDLGITCPIIPGMMPIQTYGGFKRMTTLCKTFVPEHITNALEPIQSDDSAVKSYGVKLCIEMCKRLLEAGIPGLHFYTLNLEKSVTRILRGLELIGGDAPASRRYLPWRCSAHLERKEQEEVRPIFWSNRPRSYMKRTASWDDFPNGRWGDARSPAFGEFTDYHLTPSETTTTNPKAAARKKMWGEELRTMQDVWKVFVNYCKGEINQLPWNDIPMASESKDIQAQLVKLNEHGFLTINSQPRVNGADSADSVFGWGGPGGYVYQKAYVEFFTSPENLELFLREASKHPSLSYHCVNMKGESICHSGRNDKDKSYTVAVTWGVFPGKEIIQPTVVDTNTFLVWKDEAFALWDSQWASLYEPGSPSQQLIAGLRDSHYLVHIVDNNFVSGDIFKIFDSIIAKQSS